jgi:ElaB/YqjD/DUF883 family membrane-anchored ribosome-binding protein
MKKIILSAFTLISFFAFPLFSHASYIIHLKNGGQFITSKYWEEDGQIKFFVSGGMMGIDKDTVRKIEKSNIDANEYYEINKPEKVSPQVDRTLEKAIKKEATPPDSAAKNEKVDLKAYQSKMKELRDKLDELLDNIREASKNQDKTAEEKAREEMRAISRDIFALTEELKKKNKGVLPENWWLNQ